MLEHGQYEEYDRRFQSTSWKSIQISKKIYFEQLPYKSDEQRKLKL